MPQGSWSAKRERQYKHIKESILQHGGSTERAEEIAARTVNKTRAEHGEVKAAKEAMKYASLTYAQLYRVASNIKIAGRSKMNKAELHKAISRKLA
ncbi:MAG: plasmid stabilization protein [Pseudomonadota bacterium]